MADQSRPLLLIDAYYQDAPKDYRNVIRQGCFAHVPALFLIEELQVLKIDYEDPDKQGNFNFTVVSEGPDTFEHDPIKKLNLEKDEALIAARCKRRTVLVLSEQPVPVAVPGIAGRARDFTECYAVAPLYTFGNRYPAEFKARVAGFSYPQFFYLPGDDVQGIRESFARLDRVQMAAKSLLQPKPTRLSDDSRLLFNNWVRLYFTGQVPEEYIRGLIADLQGAVASI